jgi:hypothetical protein
LEHQGVTSKKHNQTNPDIETENTASSFVHPSMILFASKGLRAANPIGQILRVRRSKSDGKKYGILMHSKMFQYSEMKWFLKYRCELWQWWI